MEVEGSRFQGNVSSKRLFDFAHDEETARTGQGTIRQIPLTENVQIEAGGGGGQQHEGSGETV